jgi:choline dehydrogenase-like flavoprotein
MVGKKSDRILIQGKSMARPICDVAVIGAGPAGSTLAALLAERGRDVLLLEKDRHPPLPYR